jgi:hypothetical protein
MSHRAGAPILGDASKANASRDRRGIVVVPDTFEEVAV